MPPFNISQVLPFSQEANHICYLSHNVNQTICQSIQPKTESAATESGITAVNSSCVDNLEGARYKTTVINSTCQKYQMTNLRSGSNVPSVT